VDKDGGMKRDKEGKGKERIKRKMCKEWIKKYYS
jgi:hypothetical protein